MFVIDMHIEITEMLLVYYSLVTVTIAVNSQSCSSYITSPFLRYLQI